MSGYVFDKIKILSGLWETHQIGVSTLRDWIFLYNTFGFEGLVPVNGTIHYSAEAKKAAVADYLSGELKIPAILAKYKIRSHIQLKRWVMKYNGHEELMSSGTGGYKGMTKGRKTTFDERVEIAAYCIAHDHNYAEAACKYQISYQQAWTYTHKYETGCVEALIDNRGKRKEPSSMSELERLRAEVRILKAEKYRAEMEVSFLKKLEEIERRRG